MTCVKPVVLLIIGNKADLEEHITTDQKDETKSMIDHLQKPVIANQFKEIGYFSTSAKTKLNINETFNAMALSMID